MPVPNTQGPAPWPFLARTRTRYCVPLSRPVTACERVVPLRCTATHSVARSVPVASAPSASADFGAAVTCTSWPVTSPGGSVQDRSSLASPCVTPSPVGARPGGPRGMPESEADQSP